MERNFEAIGQVLASEKAFSLANQLSYIRPTQESRRGAKKVPTRLGLADCREKAKRSFLLDDHIPQPYQSQMCDFSVQRSNPTPAGSSHKTGSTCLIRLGPVGADCRQKHSASLIFGVGVDCLPNERTNKTTYCF